MNIKPKDGLYQVSGANGCYLAGFVIKNGRITRRAPILKGLSKVLLLKLGKWIVD